MNTRSQIWIIFLTGVGIFLIYSCEKWDFEKASFIEVITVGSLEVGFNSSFLLGDVNGLHKAKITETGFVLSSVAHDEQSLRLDESGILLAVTPLTGDDMTNVNRAFAARATDLNEATKYFFRAYIRLETNEAAYGAIDSFQTSSLTISSPSIIKNFDGCSGEATISVNIAGAMLSPDNSYGIVWSENETDRNPNLASGTQKEATGIDPAGNFVVQMPVHCQTIYFLRGYYITAEGERYGPVKPFTTNAGGSWTPAGDFPEDFNRDLCFQSFSSHAHGFALGRNRTQTKMQLWKFNPENELWDLVSPPPSNTNCIYPTASVGSLLFETERGAFVKYESSDDLWIIVDPVISGGEGTVNLAGFSFLVDPFYYWGTGVNLNENVVYNTVFSAADGGTVLKLPDYPGGARQQTSYFILNGKGYVGLGQDNKGQFFKDFWALDFSNRSWFSVAGFTDEINSNNSFISNGKAYILTGYDVNDQPLPNFYEYDPEGDAWTRLADFGRGDGNADIGFAIDGVIYGGLGISTSGDVRREIWRYVEELR